MQEVTIVSAFFDIGRGDFNHLKRSNARYFEYFKFWARMRNRLIVYTSSEFAEEIRNIRADFGLEDRTHVVVIDNILEIEPDLLSRMTKASNNKGFRDFRFSHFALENDQSYSYVMLMKYWFLRHAVATSIAEGLVAWVDFGMNHGGSLYKNPEEFDFLWESPFDQSQIHLFALKHPSDVFVAGLLDSLSVCITGYLLVVPAKHCEQLWTLVKQAMEALLMLDCIDDDQMLLTMACRANPNLFNVHVCNWFMALKISGGAHLTIAEPILPKKSLRTRINSFRESITRWKELIRYARSNVNRMRELRKLQ